MMKRIKSFFNILLQKPWWEDKKRICLTRTVISLGFSAIAGIMLVLNIINQSIQMTVTSILLVVGFLFSAYLSAIAKKTTASAIVMACLVISIFSYFAIGGGNEGFAILWILLVPMFSLSLLGIRIGFVVSVYFLFFLPLLFYSPLNTVIADKYTSSFLSKFPVLYFSDFLVASFLSIQVEYYSRKVHIQSYMDELTGVFNRRYFSMYIAKMEKEALPDLAIMLLDMNGLKKINDSQGHKAGDELIQAVPECCKKVFGSKVIICRIGGDEFVLFLQSTEEEISQNVNKLRAIADKWKGKYSKDLHFSIGWATSGKYPGLTVMQLFNLADTQMYEEKELFYEQSGKERRGY